MSTKNIIYEAFSESFLPVVNFPKEQINFLLNLIKHCLNCMTVNKKLLELSMFIHYVSKLNISFLNLKCNKFSLRNADSF